MSEELAQNSREFTGSSEYNAFDFMIRSIIKGMVNTAIPVRVDEIERPLEGAASGYLSATPMVKMRGADGKVLPPVSIPKLRWFRLQHGTAAIICDPKPGDLGLAIFAQQDVSVIDGGTEPVQPGSFRCFDMSDGFYIGGFWGQTPSTFIHIEDDGTIHVVAPKSHTTDSPTVIINCDTATVNSKTTTVNASSSVKIDTPTTTITGDVKIQKTLSVTGHISGTGGISVSGGGGASVSGTITATGDITAGGISVQGHTHTGVHGETSSAH